MRHLHTSHNDYTPSAEDTEEKIPGHGLTICGHMKHPWRPWRPSVLSRFAACFLIDVPVYAQQLSPFKDPVYPSFFVFSAKVTEYCTVPGLLRPSFFVVSVKVTELYHSPISITFVTFQMIKQSEERAADYYLWEEGIGSDISDEGRMESAPACLSAHSFL